LSGSVQNAVSIGNVFFSGETIMQCIIKGVKNERWISWCDEYVSFQNCIIDVMDLCHHHKGDVCKDCLMALIRKLLSISDKEHFDILT
jgi:hypothetical protein